MMLAAAEYGEHATCDPPSELELAQTCRRWNCLPNEGGLLDQPAGLMRRMTIAENIYNTFRGLEESDDWTKYVQEHPLIEDIRRLRAEREKANMSDITTGGDYE
jgi:hypothetical protein